MRELAKEMAICLGNASGGTVVFGVRERVLGCDKAIVGIDFAPDLEALNSTLYDSIDPKLPVQFEWLMYGPRRLLLMHVYPSMPPYTTTSRWAWTECSLASEAIIKQTVMQRSLFASLFASV
ncbi:MAG: ATP-binding protein [Deltaproteobacteria bacterium]|nr:ATP-binding protein [Deltaproteobacteria bacterium]